LLVEAEKPAVEPQAFFFGNAGDGLYACLLQNLYPLSADLRKRICVADHHLFYAFCHKPVGAGWRFAIVCAWFEAYIHSAFWDQVFVFGIYRVQAVDLGMGRPIRLVISFADDSVVVYQNSPHHRIRRSSSLAHLRKFQASLYIRLMIKHYGVKIDLSHLKMKPVYEVRLALLAKSSTTSIRATTVTIIPKAVIDAS
jgi:hypothetical protein